MTYRISMLGFVICMEPDLPSLLHIYEAYHLYSKLQSLASAKSGPAICYPLSSHAEPSLEHIANIGAANEAV